VSAVLVVDDEPDQRFMLRRIFERAGHRVVDVSNGDAALKAVKESQPDLVVTDIMMPIMDGVELIRRLRADPDSQPIPILSVSADWQLAIAADAVMAKPYQWKELIMVAERLLAVGRGGS
jgi:CheY-like chemotaxis protein